MWQEALRIRSACSVEDSEEDDPLELARAAYVEDYNFDIPEGMDFMAHHRGRSFDDTVDMVPMCQTVSCVKRIGPDEFSDTSGMVAAVNGPDMDDFSQGPEPDEEDCVVSDVGSRIDISLNMSEQEDTIYTDVESVINFDSDDLVMDFSMDSNDGSVAELEWNTWDEACTLDFQNASGVFPPVTAGVRRRWNLETTSLARRTVIWP